MSCWILPTGFYCQTTRWQATSGLVGCGKVQIFGKEANHQNGVNVETERRLYSGKACLWTPCHCALYRECLLAFSPEVLSSRFLCKNVNTKIQKSLISACCFVRVWTGSHIRDRLYDARVAQYGTEREQVTWDWRKVHSDERHHLGIQIGEGEMDLYGREGRSCGETEGKSRLGRSRNRWQNNSEVDLQQIGW
jgi:hypothetical protein